MFLLFMGFAPIGQNPIVEECGADTALLENEDLDRTEESQTLPKGHAYVGVGKARQSELSLGEHSKRAYR